jgi:hypothetical protein
MEQLTKNSVTTIVRRRVRVGREAAYEAWLTALLRDASALPSPRPMTAWRFLPRLPTARLVRRHQTPSTFVTPNLNHWRLPCQRLFPAVRSSPALLPSPLR